MTDEQYNAVKADIQNYFKEKEKYKYSIIGVFAVWLKKSHKRDYYYFCSQFVAEILIKHNIFKTNKPADLVRPMDFFEIENKILVSSGLINKRDPYIESFRLIQFSKRVFATIKR
ncbi:MAG: hypothetical protein ACRC5H_07790 [Treponemataceae bacterium]